MSRAAARIDWRRCAVQALLLSTMQVLTFNFGYLAFLSDHRPHLAPITIGVMIATWFVFAMPLAASAQWVEGRWPWPAVALLALAACGLTIAQREVNLLVQAALGQMPDRTRSPLVTFAWIAFVGGLPFFGYCLFVQRAVRVRGVLARAELERARTATLVDQAEADALEGRVDPAMLQRSLEALQSAYVNQRAQAEALLDALVDFLRQAMPSVRSGRSTLVDELMLLRRYATLVRLVDGGRNLCSVTVEAPPCNPPFAPLLLIPLVEALARANTAAEPPHVRLTVEPACLRLELEASAGADWCDPFLAQRLERALRGTETARARCHVGGARPLTLWLPLPPAPEEFPDEERLQPA